MSPFDYTMSPPDIEHLTQWLDERELRQKEFRQSRLEFEQELQVQKIAEQDVEPDSPDLDVEEEVPDSEDEGSHRRKMEVEYAVASRKYRDALLVAQELGTKRMELFYRLKEAGYW